MIHVEEEEWGEKKTIKRGRQRGGGARESHVTQSKLKMSFLQNPLC